MGRGVRDLRSVSLLGLACLALAGCHSSNSSKATSAPDGVVATPLRASGQPMPPATAVLGADTAMADTRYSRDRIAFHTRLRREGPPPQDFEPTAVPATAHEIAYPSGDLRLKAWLSLPPSNGKPQPGLLFLHGGFAVGQDDWDMTKPFRDEGFVVLMPFLRGENGSPGAFTCFLREVDDALAAAQVLSKLPGVQADHLYVAGHSIGGTLAMLTALASDRFRAAASFSGAPNLGAWLDSNPEVAPFDLADAEELRIRSPIALGVAFPQPVRLFCGDREAWCIAQSERATVIAKSHHADVASMTVAGDHFSAVPEEERQAIAFFRSTQ